MGVFTTFDMPVNPLEYLAIERRSPGDLMFKGLKDVSLPIPSLKKRLALTCKVSLDTSWPAVINVFVAVISDLHFDECQCYGFPELNKPSSYTEWLRVCDGTMIALNCVKRMIGMPALCLRHAQCRKCLWHLV